jgi:hypothetical protein
MEPQPIDTIPLKNSLSIEIYDLSRKIAGDRWQVELLASITIPVEAHWFGPNSPAPTDIATLRAVLGEVTRFEYRETRNFIDQREKEALFESMCATVKRNAQKYYEHPDFPARYLIRQYKIHRNRPKPIAD